MFYQMTKQLEVQTLVKDRKDFNITIEEFEQFCKDFLFEQIKGDLKLGEAFCKKYAEPNFVLSILPDSSAKEHIKKFYIK
jgi:hypothetical protein